MRLSALIPDAGLPMDVDRPVAGISEDSRRIAPGWVFVAVPGTATDGHLFAADAVRRGAAAVVAERPLALPDGVPLVTVPSSRAALAELAARFYGQPAQRLKLIGFTGTFAKTTTSEILRALLAAAGRKVGVLGSLGARYGRFHDRGSGMTTPAPMELHGALRGLAEAGADTVVMEVTSHALRLRRVEGLRFSDGALAALMPGEHTDFHRTFDEYVAVKRKFVDYLAPDAILAYDADNLPARRIACADWRGARAGVALGRRPGEGPADVALTNVEIDDRGAAFTLRGERLRSSLLGRVNVRAVGLALALALARDLDICTARLVLPRLEPLPRRMQRFPVAGREVLDDVAAHPDNFVATFEVAAVLRPARLVAVYAVRGQRGADLNRRNAIALADLVVLHDAAPLIVTGSLDQVGPSDRPSDEEIDVTRRTLADRGCSHVWHETLAAAAADAAVRSRRGDLVMLLGAQGMDHGAALLIETLA